MASSSGAVNRPAHNAPVLVIGLGRFGASTAEQLVKQGREVLAIERDRNLVQKWSSVLTHVVEADATNIDALRQLGAQEFSSAVVGVGTSIESSVLITVNLVDLGIEHLWVKAITPSHGKILTRIGANHVIYPEADAGVRAAHLVSGRMLDFIEFDDDFAIVKMYPPRETVGLHAGRIQGPVQIRRHDRGREVPGRGLHLRPAGDQGVLTGHAHRFRPRGPAGAVRRPAVAEAPRRRGARRAREWSRWRPGSGRRPGSSWPAPG